MPWGRLDDRANDSPKLRLLSDAAWRMWGCGLVYCQAHLTDGFIPEGMVYEFGVKARNIPAVVAELLAVKAPGKGPLWHREPGGYRVHDYLDWNDPRHKVIGERDRADKRKQKFKQRRSGPAIDSVQNAFGTRSRHVLERVPDASGTATERGSTYHVPRTYERQVRADAPSAPVEPVENRTVLMWRRRRSRETSSGKPAERVIAALARAVLSDHPAVEDEGELLELVKGACARANLLYDSRSAARAIDSARAQLRRRKAVPA